ncbi:MAG: anti-sigma factor, partial [Steroidobacteraceae bacterium]
DELLAAELVLGVLNPEERASAQRRSESDPAFAQRVAHWEGRFAPWLFDIEPVAVPAHVWPQIRVRLGWQSRGGARSGLWQSLAFWRGAALLASIAAAVAIMIGRLPSPGPRPPPEAAVSPTGAEAAAQPVSTLAREDGTPGWLASVDRARGTVLMVPVPTPPDSKGRVPELWLIPPGQAPRSLGLVSIDRAHTVKVPADLRLALASGSVLAITLEPPGGAPRGVPTGPIIAKGPLRI